MHAWWLCLAGSASAFVLGDFGAMVPLMRRDRVFTQRYIDDPKIPIIQMSLSRKKGVLV